MKLFKCINNSVQNEKLLIDCFNIKLNAKNIISFVGGGGKTTLIYALGKELSSLGKKVIVTTTTNMVAPENNVVLTGDLNHIASLLSKENLVTVGTLCSSRSYDAESNNYKKITGLSKDLSSHLIDLCDVLLVESDGSRRLPLKIPADHEPVIFEGSNLVIGVCGIDSVGKPINKTCHRPERVADFLNVDEDHIITEKDIAKILFSDKGQKKNVKCDYKVVVNKVDNCERLNLGKNISYEFLKLGGSELILTKLKNILEP